MNRSIWIGLQLQWLCVKLDYDIFVLGYHVRKDWPFVHCTYTFTVGILYACTVYLIDRKLIQRVTFDLLLIGL